MPDLIITELRKIRDAYSAKFQGDVAAMLDDLEASRIAAGRQCVKFPPKIPKPRILGNEFLREKIRIAQAQADAGLLIDHDEVFSELLGDDDDEPNSGPDSRAPSIVTSPSASDPIR